jgi:hypothetical protein
MQPFFSCPLLLILLPTVISISIPNLVPAGGVLSLENASQISNTSVATNPSDPRIFPYSFHVPYSDITLFLGFGVLKRQPLDGIEMRRLILSAQERVRECIRRLGPDGLVPIAPDKTQDWTYWMKGGNGPLEIGIESWEVDAQRKITWGQVAVVLEGLRLYLIDGKRFWVTSLNFMEGNRWSLRPGLIGRGFLRRSGYEVTNK